MEMELNAALIKKQRSNRAWSQTQLAEVSGLSLRTVQRIEKTGVASLESVKSIAAVFELEIKDMQLNSENNQRSFKINLTTLLTVIGLVLSGFFIFPATAESIMVDVSVSSDGKALSKVQMLNEENSENEIIIAGALKIIFNSKKEDNGNVTIATKLYDLSQESEKLISSPRVTTQHKKSAEIHFGHYILTFTPQ